MSYSQYNRRLLVMPQLDMGAGGEVYGYQLPDGVSARLIDYGAQYATEAAAGTLNPTIAIGTASDPDAYGDELTLNYADADGFTVLSDIPAADQATYIVQPEIPAGSLIKITIVGSTGSSAGIACPVLELDLSAY